MIVHTSPESTAFPLPTHLRLSPQPSTPPITMAGNLNSARTHRGPKFWVPALSSPQYDLSHLPPDLGHPSSTFTVVSRTLLSLAKCVDALASHALPDLWLNIPPEPDPKLQQLP